MAFNLKQGFRGIVRIDGSRYVRVTSADIQVRQEAQTFLPTYGGRRLKRIWHRGTGDITGTLSLMLCENDAEWLYGLADEQEEFYMDLHYYGSKDRRFLGCKIQELTFNCAAGEIVAVTVNVVAKDVGPRVRSLEFTKGQKLVTWDKCDVRFPIPTFFGDDLQSFTYTVNNGLKSIKTAAGLFPKILNPAIQEVSGQFQFYNKDDIVIPPDGAYEYGLGFRNVRFRIDDLELEHDVVFHPNQIIPLVPASLISTISWSRSDDF